MSTAYGCKVCRVLAERGLEEYERRLLRQWRGEDGDRKGYRQLARWLNVTLLRREMETAGLPTLGDEPASKYDRLRSDDHASEVTTVLEREGIDVGRLRSDFVSYGVVRTHIVDCLDEEYESTQRSGWETDTIEIARDHAATKIGEAVSALAGKDEIGVGNDVTVHPDVEVECERCGVRLPLGSLLSGEQTCSCASVDSVTGG
jgi:hypothetical protein